MPRLNIKTTKAAIVKTAKFAQKERMALDASTPMYYYYTGKKDAALQLAKELEIDIKPEEYQG